MKQRFLQFVTNTATTEEVTASIQSNKKGQDIQKEVSLSAEAENSKQVQGISNYLFPLSPRQWVNHEQSAKEFLLGVKEDMQIENIIPAGGELTNEEVQECSNWMPLLSPEQWANLEQLAKEILLGVEDMEVEDLVPGKQLQGTSNCTPSLSRQEWDSREQLDKDILLGVKEDMQVENTIPARGDIPVKQVQKTSNSIPQMSPQQWVSIEESAKEILLGVKKAVKVEYLMPARKEGDRYRHFILLHYTV
jgi:hypothetical protein